MDIDLYTYRIEWSDDDKVHIARCLEFPSLLAHGDSSEQALKEIKEIVRESIEWMMEEGEDIPQPLGLKKYKGKLTLRVSPEIHKQLAIQSAEQGISINQYILSKL